MVLQKLCFSGLRGYDVQTEQELQEQKEDKLANILKNIPPTSAAGMMKLVKGRVSSLLSKVSTSLTLSTQLLAAFKVLRRRNLHRMM